MSCDIEDLKKLVESDGWKFYISELEKMIQAQAALVEIKSSLEDFLKIKYTVIAYKTAVELPNYMIERESPA